VRGVATAADESWQLVLVDLPGVQRPRDSLTKRMQRRVEHELADADAVLLVLNGEQGVGPGDRFIATALLGAGGTPVICAVNKGDRLGKPEMAKALADAEALGVADEIFPVSAKTGSGIEPMVEDLTRLMPEGPLLYPAGERTDLPRDVVLGELIREQVLRLTRQEVPHAVEVTVTDVSRREDGLIDVAAEVWVETDSQKGILVGRGGGMIRDVGTASRRELERELDAHVFLDLEVKLRRHWRRDDALLDRLGIE
jgi:GTP-binding protein Era